MRIPALTLAIALAAPASGFASEALLPGPSAGWGLPQAWRESLARALGAERADDRAALASASLPLLEIADEGRRVRVRASSSHSPRVLMTLPAWVAGDGRSGLDIAGATRRPRTGLHANGIPDRTLWSVSAEAWRDLGPLTAYGGAGTGRSSDWQDPARLERSAYAGLEFDGFAGTWRIESGWLKGDPALGTERDVRIGWRGPVAPGWSLGVEAGALQAPGFTDRSVTVSLRGRLR